MLTLLYLAEHDIEAALDSGTPLKGGRDYEVIRFDRGGTQLVLKRARNSGPATDRLVVEFERIMLLVAVSPDYSELMVEPLAAGFHRHHFYYVMPFVDGLSLSDLLRSEVDTNKARSAVEGAVTMGWNLQNVQMNVPTNIQDFLSFIRHFITAEYAACRNSLPPGMIDEPELRIDGQRCVNLGSALDQLFSLQTLDSLRDQFTLETHRHWNLHGGNVLFDNQSNIHLIDPDTKILVHDPLFELARLFYTARHDMVEFGTFAIEGQLGNDFRIKYILDEHQKRNYALLHDVDLKFPTGMSAPATPQDMLLYWRLRLTYLSCLIRGINANYQEGENDSLEVQRMSHSLFLYLIATQFVNQLLEE